MPCGMEPSTLAVSAKARPLEGTATADSPIPPPSVPASAISSEATHQTESAAIGDNHAAVVTSVASSQAHLDSAEAPPASMDPTPNTPTPAPTKIPTFDKLSLMQTRLGTDYKATMSHIYHRDKLTTPTAEDLAQVTVLVGQKETWIRHLYDAIVDIANVGDNPSSEAFKAFVDENSPSYEPEDILVGCACLWNEVVKGARSGWRSPFARTAQLKKAIIASEKVRRYTGDLSSRLGKIIEALKREKTICISVIELDITQIRSLVLAPTESAEIKEQVRITNNKRAAKNVAKKDAKTHGKAQVQSAAGTFSTAASNLSTSTQLPPRNRSYVARSARSQPLAQSSYAPGDVNGASSLPALPHSAGDPSRYTMFPSHGSILPMSLPRMDPMGMSQTYGFPTVMPSQSIQQTVTPVYGQTHPDFQPKWAHIGGNDIPVSQYAPRASDEPIFGIDNIDSGFINMPLSPLPYTEAPPTGVGLQEMSAPLHRVTRPNTLKRSRAGDDDDHVPEHPSRGRKAAKLDNNGSSSSSLTTTSGHLPSHEIPSTGNVLGDEAPTLFEGSPVYGPAYDYAYAPIGPLAYDTLHEPLRDPIYEPGYAPAYIPDWGHSYVPADAPVGSHLAEFSSAPAMPPGYGSAQTLPGNDSNDAWIDPSLDQLPPLADYTVRRR